MKAANKGWTGLALWLCLFCAGAWHSSLAAPGDVDLSFDAGSGVNGTVNAVVLQSDGKVLVGGDFTTVRGAFRNGIARLNADGSVDGTLDPGTGANGSVSCLALQADGKVLVGGAFGTVNGVSRSCIARLNADRSVDNTFNPGTGVNGSVNSLVLQPDGKVLVGGGFTDINGVSRNYIARLHPDGSVDSAFNPGTGANDTVCPVVLQPDGRVLIGGWFGSLDGVSRNHIARLNTDGSVDGTFNPGTGADSIVYSLALQPDGKVLAGGGVHQLQQPAPQ